MKYILFGTLIILLLNSQTSLLAQERDIETSNIVEIKDANHYSHVFADVRKYRIFFPPNYRLNQKKRYPVIYFFHGWAQRYFGEMADGYSDYEKGDDNEGDNIAAFVTTHDVIVVKIDGLNQFSNEDLNLTPYNIGTVSTFRQFPLYFKEFVNYIDVTYRTIPDRDHRAVSGLSMGGFMTFWVVGKYPHLVSAAGNFCGSLEMAVGPREFPVAYNHIDMADNYDGVNVRFHYGSKDRLRYYHYDFLKVWPQIRDNFQYHIYDASHVTCGLGDMFEFLMENFKYPPAKPDNWHHIDVYPNFEIWDYQITSDRSQAGFTVLENVNKRGFKSSVRTFLPDGEPMPQVDLIIKTPPIYLPNHPYEIIDVNTINEVITRDTSFSDSEGILILPLNGDEHHIGINKMDDLPNICISSVAVKNMNWAMTQKYVVISLGLLNKGFKKAKNLKLDLTSIRDYVHVKESMATIADLEVGEIETDVVDFTVFVEEDTIEIAGFRLTVEDQSGNSWIEEFRIPFRKEEQLISDYIIADGGTYTVVAGGVDSVTEVLGAGNADGIANPGEMIVLLVEHEGKFYRTNAYTSDLNVNPTGFPERVIDSWADYDHIGGGPRYTIPVIAPNCPDGKSIDFWVEYWLPNSPEHIIKRGTIQIQVEGDVDRTPPVFRWIRVLNDRTMEVKVSDASRVASVQLKLTPNQEAADQRYLIWDTPEAFTISLRDEGSEDDKCAGDNVFSLEVAGKPSYFYNAEIIIQDTFGNATTFKNSQPIFLQDTR